MAASPIMMQSELESLGTLLQTFALQSRPSRRPPAHFLERAHLASAFRIVLSQPACHDMDGSLPVIRERRHERVRDTPPSARTSAASASPSLIHDGLSCGAASPSLTCSIERGTRLASSGARTINRKSPRAFDGFSDALLGPWPDNSTRRWSGHFRGYRAYAASARLRGAGQLLRFRAVLGGDDELALVSWRRGRPRPRDAGRQSLRGLSRPGKWGVFSRAK